MTIHDRFDCQTDNEMSLIAEAMVTCLPFFGPADA